jgi:hypothetical protein
MRIIGCDLHARQQTIAMLDTDTGELEEKTLEHQGETVREFYSTLRGPILVGIEATGSLKNQIGLRRVRLRRMKHVREQFFLAATAQNLKRLARFLRSRSLESATVPI